MRIEMVRALPGPNVYLHRPVLHARIDLEGLAETESVEFAGFNDRLLALLPGLREHHCGLERPGGFVERLRGGTYFGHVVEHVAAMSFQTFEDVEIDRRQRRAARERAIGDISSRIGSMSNLESILQTAVEELGRKIGGSAEVTLEISPMNGQENG